MRVLVAEDDADLRTAISAALQGAGIRVSTAADLEDVDVTLATTAFDGLVLSRSLSGGDALDYVARRRRAGWTVPVLFLTERPSVDDRVQTLTWGDDFLAKPFEMAELAVRVRSLAHRSHAPTCWHTPGTNRPTSPRTSWISWSPSSAASSPGVL